MTAIAAPGELDRELESERAGWLRRRFLVYCALWVVVAAAFVLSEALSPHPPWNRAVVTWDVATTVAGLLVASAAGLYAWRRPARRAALFALTYWLTVAGFVLTAAFWHGQVLFDDDRGTTFRDAAGGLAVAVVARHLLPCLLIPWTLRESLRPAAALVALCAAVLVYDVVDPDVALAPRWAALYFALCCLAVAPGAAVAWVRSSRFRTDFSLRFVSARYRALQAELAGARRVHESCLPQPVTSGAVRVGYAYEPMREIGGDRLFVHPPGGAEGAGALSAVVLDVTGHGIAAALTVNRLVGELERLFGDDPGIKPGDVLAALNRYVTRTLARYDLYATALCVRVDAGAGEVEWASAGHPPAYLRRRGGEVEALGATAPMLGVMGPDEFEPEPARLASEPGDALLAYTDGASESADENGRQLGCRGVMRLVEEWTGDALAPERWPGALLESVRARRGAGKPAEDDTLVAVVTRE
jgi:hypothetical protein